MSATDYRNHIVKQSYCILNARHYFCKHAKVKVIYQIQCEMFCSFIDGVRNKYGRNEVAERRSSTLASKQISLSGSELMRKEFSRISS